MPFTIINTNNNVEPFTNLKLEIISNGVVQSQYTTKADSIGNFTLNPTISQELEGTILQFQYTNLDTGEVKVIDFDAPPLSKVPLELFFPHIIYTGSNSGYGSYSVFPGVPVAGDLNNSGGLYRNLSRNGLPANASTIYNFVFPFGVEIGSYSGSIQAPGYPNEATTNFEVKHGLDIQLQTPSGLRFRGDTHTVRVRGEPNVNVVMNLFDRDYTITLDNDGVNVLTVDIPTDAPFGSATATFVAPDVPFTPTIQFRIDNEADYALTANVPERIITNVQNNSNGEITGLALPGKVVTISIPELGLNLQATADVWGNYSIAIPNTPWQASGSFNFEARATDETAINGNGTHHPDVQFISQVNSVNQGDTARQFQVRADSNIPLKLNISGFIRAERINTATDGYVTLGFPAIPLETYAPSSIATTVSYDNSPGYGNNFTTSISPRVPLTIAVANPPSIPGFSNILFTNTTYSVTGNAPTNTGILSLSAVGDVASFERDSYERDSYTATLVTSTEPTEIQLSVSTVFQPSTSQGYRVAYPLTLTVPEGQITYNDEAITITLFSVPEIPATLVISYLNSTNNTIYSQTFTQQTNNNGDAIFSFQPHNLSATAIQFKGFVTNIYHLIETRPYQSRATATLVPPELSEATGLVSHTDFGSSLSSWSKNLLDTDVYAEATFFPGNIVKNNEPAWGFYLLGLIQSYPSRAGINNMRSSDPYLANGFTTFRTYLLTGSATYLQLFTTSNTFRTNNGNVYLRLNNRNYYADSSLELNRLYDLCFVYTKEDPDNNDNSTYKLFANGNLILKYEFDSVFTFAGNSSLGYVQASQPIHIANNLLLYNRSLTNSEVASFYADGVRKKIRKSNFADVAKHHYFSIFPSPNGYGYHTVTKTIVGGEDPLYSEDLKKAAEGSNYVSGNLPPVTTDSQDRKYFNLNGSNHSLTVNTDEPFSVDFYLVLQRKTFDNSKQVIFDYRTSHKLLEVAFTGVNQITMTHQKSDGSFESRIYQSNALASEEILCFSFGFDNNFSEITYNYLQGVTLNPISTTTVSQPNQLNIIEKITIGSKAEQINFAAINFYGYLAFKRKQPAMSVSNLISSSVFNGDAELFNAYIFYVMGFPEAMLNKDSTFPLLAQRDGFYYL